MLDEIPPSPIETVDCPKASRTWLEEFGVWVSPGPLEIPYSIRGTGTGSILAGSNYRGIRSTPTYPPFLTRNIYACRETYVHYILLFSFEGPTLSFWSERLIVALGIVGNTHTHYGRNLCVPISHQLTQLVSLPCSFPEPALIWADGHPALPNAPLHRKR